MVLKMVNEKYVAIWGEKRDPESNDWISFSMYFCCFKLSDY